MRVAAFRLRWQFAQLGALALLLATSARAEMGAEPPANVVLADVGLHAAGIGYQRTVMPWMALQLDIAAYSPWTQNINLLGASVGYESDLTGVIVRIRPIFFGLLETPRPAGGPPTGFWISPFVQFGRARATRDGAMRTGNVWAAGVSGGWSWLFADHLWLLVGVGGQHHVAAIPDNEYPPSFARLYPTVDINIGYAF
jgi:hypothetical protein